MPVSFKIPKRLERFAPVLEWFSNNPAEQLDADPDVSYVTSFLRSLYSGLDVEEAEKAWELDRRALEKVVDAHGEQCPWLYFFHSFAYLSPQILHDLLEHDKEVTELPPPLILRVSLPNDFHVQNGYGSVFASTPAADISLIPTAESVLEFKLRNLRQQAQDWAEVREEERSQVEIQYVFTQADWETVSGWKVIESQFSPRNSKHITYLLKVPGGACFAEISCKDVKFDESQLEEYLSTISVERTSLD